MKKPKALNEDQVLKAKAFLAGASVFSKPDPDRGTCVLGNGITADYLAKGCRKPKRTYIFTNPWTQGEQYDAINELLVKVREHFPEFAEQFHYEYGRID